MDKALKRERGRGWKDFFLFHPKPVSDYWSLDFLPIWSKPFPTKSYFTDPRNKSFLQLQVRRKSGVKNGRHYRPLFSLFWSFGRYGSQVPLKSMILIAWKLLERVNKSDPGPKNDDLLFIRFIGIGKVGLKSPIKKIFKNSILAFRANFILEPKLDQKEFFIYMKGPFENVFKERCQIWR